MGEGVIGHFRRINQVLGAINVEAFIVRELEHLAILYQSSQWRAPITSLRSSVFWRQLKIFLDGGHDH